MVAYQGIGIAFVIQGTITEMATEAVNRYVRLTEMFRRQTDLALQKGADSAVVRDATMSASRTAAREFIALEHQRLNDETELVARMAYEQARQDLGLKEEALDDRFGEFVFSAARYTTQLLSAQVERDLVTVEQQVRQDALRIDIYVRSGRHTRSSATAAVMLEGNSGMAFRFLDRAGRKFKSTKHIRDTYRHHLLTVYNEVYLDVAAEHGRDVVFVSHPDPAYAWSGRAVALVNGTDETPLYYDIREEVFHPSSNAILTVRTD